MGIWAFESFVFRAFRVEGLGLQAARSRQFEAGPDSFSPTP